MTTAVIALAAAAAALLIVGLIAGVGHRARRRSEERVTRALETMGARMDSLARDLGEAIARSQEATRRIQVLGEVGGSIELDEVLARTADAAAGLAGAQASVVHARAVDGTQLVAAAGVPLEEAEQHAVSGPPDGATVRAVSLAYVYDNDESAPGAIRSGLAVPLESDEERLGFLAVYSPVPGENLADVALTDLEALAERAAPAIENARRFREARQLADMDALTGLYNRRMFHETLAREVARAHRYDRRLALVLLDLDDFKEVNDAIGHLAGDAVLAEAAERMREVVRTADIPCRTGGDEFAVILPESGLADADGLFARITATMQRRPPSGVEALGFSGGVAELRADDDAVSFFERADEALYRAKSQGKGTAAAAATPERREPRSTTLEGTVTEAD